MKLKTLKDLEGFIFNPKEKTMGLVETKTIKQEAIKWIKNRQDRNPNRIFIILRFNFKPAILRKPMFVKLQFGKDFYSSNNP